MMSFDVDFQYLNLLLGQLRIMFFKNVQKNLYSFRHNRCETGVHPWVTRGCHGKRVIMVLRGKKNGEGGKNREF